MMTNKRWAVLAVLAVLVAVLHSPAGGLSALPRLKRLPVSILPPFNKAIGVEQRGGLRTMQPCHGWNTSESREGKTDGLASIMAIETANLGDSVRAKIYYENSDGQVRLRYLKLRDIAGRYRVVDDKMLGGGEWISLSYRKGLFAKAREIGGGVRVRVVGILEVPPEIKFDIIVENVSGPGGECFIYFA